MKSRPSAVSGLRTDGTNARHRISVRDSSFCVTLVKHAALSASPQELLELESFAFLFFSFAASQSCVCLLLVVPLPLPVPLPPLALFACSFLPSFLFPLFLLFFLLRLLLRHFHLALLVIALPVPAHYLCFCVLSVCLFPVFFLFFLLLFLLLLLLLSLLLLQGYEGGRNPPRARSPPPSAWLVVMSRPLRSIKREDFEVRLKECTYKFPFPMQLRSSERQNRRNQETYEAPFGTVSLLFSPSSTRRSIPPQGSHCTR